MRLELCPVHEANTTDPEEGVDDERGPGTLLAASRFGIDMAMVLDMLMGGYFEIPGRSCTVQLYHRGEHDPRGRPPPM
jgi:hypothetical protein